MTVIRRALGAPLHPLHAALLVCAVPLFIGALLSDLAYSSSYEIQWKNFASWLIAGALVFNGLTILWAAVSFLRAGRLSGGPPLFLLLLLIIAYIMRYLPTGFGAIAPAGRSRCLENREAGARRLPASAPA